MVLLDGMSDEQRQELISVFNTHGVSQGDQDFWFSRLEDMKEEMRNHVLVLFTMFPEDIGWLRNIQERKEQALATDDRSEWDLILKEEEEHFNRTLIH